MSAPRLALSFTPPRKKLNDSIKCTNSTRSKCPLRKRICIFTFHAEAQKRKLQNYSPSAPLPPQRNKTKPKRPGKKSRKKKKKKTGERQSDEEELHSHQKQMPNQSRQCVILTKKSAECAENRSGREDTKGRRPSRPVCPSLFLRYPPPKKMKKRKILLPHLLGGGGVPTGKRLVPCWHFGAT